MSQAIFVRDRTRKRRRRNRWSCMCDCGCGRMLSYSLRTVHRERKTQRDQTIINTPAGQGNALEIDGNEEFDMHDPPMPGINEVFSSILCDTCTSCQNVDGEPEELEFNSENNVRIRETTPNFDDNVYEGEDIDLNTSADNEYVLVRSFMIHIFMRARP